MTKLTNQQLADLALEEQRASRDAFRRGYIDQANAHLRRAYEYCDQIAANG